MQTYSSGTQVIWIINANTLTMVKSFTYSNTQFKNPLSVFTFYNNALYIPYVSASQKLSLAGVDTLNL